MKKNKRPESLKKVSLLDKLQALSYLMEKQMKDDGKVVKEGRGDRYEKLKALYDSSIKNALYPDLADARRSLKIKKTGEDIKHNLDVGREIRRRMEENYKEVKIAAKK